MLGTTHSCESPYSVMKLILSLRAVFVNDYLLELQGPADFLEAVTGVEVRKALISSELYNTDAYDEQVP